MNDAFISTRVRLARNRRGVRFPSKISEREARELVEAVKDALGDGYVVYDAASASETEAGALMERHLVSRELLSSRRGAAITDGETVSVMVCEEDHFRIQSILRGFDPTGAYEAARVLDEKISKRVEYAFSERLGYLTACPTNLGCGMRLSVMAFLPALCKSGRLEEAIASLSSLGITVRGEKGEGTRGVGYAYQISNRTSLGVSEREIVTAVSEAARRLAETEDDERYELLSRNGDESRDKTFRALGALKHCYIMTDDELGALFGEIKFGASCGFLRGMTIPEIDEVYARLQPYNLTLEEGRRLSEGERVRVRAARLPDALRRLKEVR